MTKFLAVLICALVALIVIGGVLYDHKVSALQQKLAQAQGVVDTLTVTIKVHDTTFISMADTIREAADTIRVGDTVTINHYPMLVDHTEQPLFGLTVRVDGRTSIFGYDYQYRPLSLSLRFADKYDLRKGFTAELTPPIAPVVVNWGDYQPLKKKIGVAGALGIGYSKFDGVFALGDITWKKTALGVLAREGSLGVYVKRTIFDW